MELAFAIVLIALLVCSYNLWLAHKKNKFHNLVAFAMDKDALMFVCNTQNYINTDEIFLIEYRGEESRKITAAFQNYLAKRYFSGSLTPNYGDDRVRYLMQEMGTFVETHTLEPIFENGLLTDHGMAVYRFMHTFSLYFGRSKNDSHVLQIENHIRERLKSDAAAKPARKKRTKKE